MQSDLVIRAQNGDRSAFASLAEAVGDRFYAAAYSILRDRTLAEDASQQALVRMWRNLPQLRDPARFDAWSYRLLVNACHSLSKAERRWLPRMLGPIAEPATDDAVGQVADQDQLERAFRDLSIDQRTVVVLHHYLGLTVAEVADAVEAPIETVRSRLRYGLRAMRATIEADTRPPTASVPAQSAGRVPPRATSSRGTR